MKKFDTVLKDKKGEYFCETTWYGDTIEEAKEFFERVYYEAPYLFDNTCEVIEDTVLDYMIFVNEILKNVVRTVYDHHNRPVYIYKINDNTHILIRQLQQDGFFFPDCQYKEINIDPETLKELDYFGKLNRPMLWDYCTCKEFLERFRPKSRLEFVEYSKRIYGQPKLLKPKELKKIKQSFSIDYIANKCTCSCFIKDNDIWIKHRDYFSNLFRPDPKDIGQPTSYICKKYFNQDKKDKFVYADNWAGVVLRNEAWLCIKNLLVQIKHFDELNTMCQLKKGIEKFYKEKYGWNSLLDDNTELRTFYERLVKELYKQIKENLKNEN